MMDSKLSRIIRLHKYAVLQSMILHFQTMTISEQWEVTQAKLDVKHWFYLYGTSVHELIRKMYQENSLTQNGILACKKRSLCFIFLNNLHFILWGKEFIIQLKHSIFTCIGDNHTWSLLDKEYSCNRQCLLYSEYLPAR